MRLDLSGKVAIITGASRGIGRQTALTLAGAGATVVLTSRGDAAEAVAAEVTAAGGQALALAADVADADAVQRVIETANETFGRIDILVNNAGITRDQLLLRMKREDWDAVVATNLTGTFLCTQAVLRTMLKQRSGRIISISSVVGQSGNPGQTNYAATKAGHHRLLEGARARSRLAGHHGERGGPGVHRHGHDAGHQLGRRRRTGRRPSRSAFGHAG